MEKKLREQEEDLCNQILGALTQLRQTTRERAKGVALDYQMARKELQDRTIRERRDKGHPNWSSRGVYAPLNLSAPQDDEPFSLRWFVQHYSQGGSPYSGDKKPYYKPINKGRNTFRYSMGALMPHIPLWGRDLAKRTECRAALVRARWASLTAVIWAVRALKRWITSKDGLATESELDFDSAPPGHSSNVTSETVVNSTPTARDDVREAYPERIAPAPPRRPGEIDWDP